MAKAPVPTLGQIIKATRYALNMQPRFKFPETEGFTDSYQLASAFDKLSQPTEAISDLVLLILQRVNVDPAARIGDRTVLESLEGHIMEVIETIEGEI